MLFCVDQELGKTHTIQGSRENPGVIRRALRHIFDKIRSTGYSKLHVSISFLEIYNDKVYDLLVDTRPSVQTTSLELCCLQGQTWYVKGLSENHALSEGEALAILAKGERNRTIGETTLNLVSSRSHSVFTIKLIQKSDDSSATRTLSKLCLVDLAGAERTKHTAQGTQPHQTPSFKEAVHINTSLFTLHKCLEKLKNNQPSLAPFRDSKLTSLLKDYLTGWARTVMIATAGTNCVPNLDTLRSTLKYASMSNNIRTVPMIDNGRIRSEASNSAAFSEDNDYLLDEIENLQKEINRLKDEYDAAESRHGLEIADALRQQLDDVEKENREILAAERKLSEEHMKRKEEAWTKRYRQLEQKLVSGHDNSSVDTQIIMQLNVELDAVRQELHERNGRLDEALESTRESESLIQSLSKAKENLEVLNESLRSRISHLELEHRLLQSENERLQTEKNNLSIDASYADKLQSENAALQCELQNLKKNNDLALAELEKDRESFQIQMESKLKEKDDAFDVHLQKMKDEYDEIRTKYETLRSELEEKQSLLKEIPQLEAKYQELLSIHEDSVSNFESQQAALEGTIKSLNEQLDREVMAVSEVDQGWKECLSIAENAKVYLEDRVSDLERQISSQRELLNSKDDALFMLQKDFDVVSQDKKTILEENKSLRKDLAKLEKQCKGLEAHVSENQAQIVNENANLLEENKRLVSEMKLCDKTFQEQEEELVSLKDRVSKLEKERDQLSREKEKLKKNNKELMTKMQEIQSERSSVRLDPLQAKLNPSTSKSAKRVGNLPSSSDDSEELIPVSKARVKDSARSAFKFTFEDAYAQYENSVSPRLPQSDVLFRKLRICLRMMLMTKKKTLAPRDLHMERRLVKVTRQKWSLMFLLEEHLLLVEPELDLINEILLGLLNSD
jgi:DNA repair exonuclease SbcCD ATPase subunit